MSTKFDIGDLDHELAGLRAHPNLNRIAFVVPLAPGMRKLAADAVAEGPPFNPLDVGISSHEVLLSEREAIFVFELEAGVDSLERILASDEFWTVVGWWEHIADGRPQIAEVAYEWHAA
jgi:hypothetical protein